MSVRRKDHLRAEIGMLEEMLANISRGRVIERVGLESRTAQLRAELEQFPREGLRLDLTFRGEPVQGSRSIIAEFAGRALAAFSDAVATIAASLEREIGSTGPLPGGGNSRALRVLGPALGSFGFELEVPPPPPPDPQTSFFADEAANPMDVAVERAMNLIDAAQEADEEKLSDLIADVHPRAAGKVREFVKLVVDARATFNLRVGERKSGLADVDSGQRVLVALRVEDVREDERTEKGRLWVLPVGRQFELRTDDELLKGRISRGVADPGSLQSGAMVVAKLRKMTLRAARPRYTLVSAEPQGASGGRGPNSRRGEKKP